MGKSMMMTHFMLDTIKKNQQDGQIPVLFCLGIIIRNQENCLILFLEN